VLKRGEKEDSRDLYKIMQSNRKAFGSSTMNTEYTIAFSKTPNGMIQGRMKDTPMIDPVIGPNESNVSVFIKHFWNELVYKFRNLSDAFRQFNISKNSKLSFTDFNYMLDTLSIRFSQD